MKLSQHWCCSPDVQPFCPPRSPNVFSPARPTSVVANERCSRSCGPRRTGVASAPAALAAPAAQSEASLETAVSPAATQTSQQVQAAVAESLKLLEWPSLCAQVSCFCQTPMGAELGMRAELPVGLTQQESEVMLQETAEAQVAQLTFEGAYDIRRAVTAVLAGQVLHPLVLGAVASTLAAAQRAEGVLQQVSPAPTSLLELAAGIGAALPEVQEEITTCIQPGDGRILDSASEMLAALRAQRRENQAELRREMEAWARKLHAKGICERPQVVLRRDRQCVPVRLGRQGELPKGSVTLATSASGSTLYMEPAPCVALNNTEMALAGAEQAEEERVLIRLSQLVAQHATHIARLMQALTALDVATARARHAAWVGASRPRFLTAHEAAAVGPVRIPAALHPLLLQSSLPAPPMPPLTEQQLQALQHRQQQQQPQQQQQQQQQQQADEAVGGFDALSGLSLVPELAAASTPAPLSATAAAAGSKDTSAGENSAQAQPKPPQPVDLSVPPSVAVVAVTGPNTGGKTASLKTLGLLSLMAKAGLFLPQQQQLEGAAPSTDQRPTPALLWFDRVLADLGDGQSLQQSLSTFSGHVRRIRGVLAAATPASLVLLDEVGSGTDPQEGAALAAALLEHLRACAALTYATTHHAELKELATSSPGFVNASVEFDLATLRPTYRLMWGQAGESNALSIARGLGFSATVVAEATEVSTRLRQQQAAADQGAALQASLQEQVGDAQAATARAAAARKAAEAELATAREALAALRQQAAEAGKATAAQAAKVAAGQVRSQVQQVLADVRADKMTLAQAEERLRALESQARAASSAVLGSGGGDADTGVPAPEGWAPRVGDAVLVLRMGGAPGSVVSVSGRTGGKVGVRVGSMTVELRVADLAPAGKRGSDSTPSSSAGGSGRGGPGAAKQKLARALKPGSGAVLAATAGVALQTAQNTVDVRGQPADEAETTVCEAVASAPSGWTLYVIHGVGTGRVRAAVLAALRRHPRVAKLEEEERSNGGCTVVTLQ